ncbi:hypothetical protein [Fimbriiglobus ruber]|uniref:Uncharacterized protein n=1 Tax=Fimbriiglobus ruber TaxID=1908690 RepID=A0A225D022_9BACT|nr:hypothetical protein [Fimbriiglobus ruber]OWK34852.1 hypothetical protein FRUB_09694 [Fimbriiglobus ruber]
MTRSRTGLSGAGLLFAVVLSLAAARPAAAQVIYPPKPEKYDAHIRYRIRADQDGRVRQFRALSAYLDKLGFALTPREDSDLDAFDPAAEFLSGTIPAANGLKILGDPLVQTVLLIPGGMMLGEDANKPVQVRLGIATGFHPKEQRVMHEQVVRHLGFLGFREAIAYDSAGFTLVRGALPTGNLFRLLRDLRFQPAGWFLTAVPTDYLPSPFRDVLPVRFVEVLPDLPAPAAAAAAPPAAPPGDAAAASPALFKLTTDLRSVLADPAAREKELRADVILENNPTSALTWQTVRNNIRQGADGLTVEGLVGAVVTVRVAKASELERLATLAEVRTIRLTRAGIETARPAAAGATAVNPADLVKTSRVANLHGMNYTGEGVRVVVLATEFPGLDALVGQQLPATTRFLDLTAELNPELVPAPVAADRVGTGTAAALAAVAAAPRADLVLIRVSPTAFHQLMTVARAVTGDPNSSEALQSRSLELILRGNVLENRRTVVTQEYRAAFATLRDEEKETARRAAAVAAFNQLNADEAQFKNTVERFARIKYGLESLRGAGVVVNTLVWDAGFPQDGLSELSRLLDDKFTSKAVQSALRAYKLPPVPVWVQAASTAVGQVWAGAYLDPEGDGVMAFAPPTTPLPAGRWTRELNFLSFTAADGTPATAAPAGSKFRLTVQWREPQDPDGHLPREPVFPLDLVLLRQLDPEGKVVASDEFAEVGRSTGIPVRLMRTFGSCTYEQSLEVMLPADGVYAVRVEGKTGYEYQLPHMRQKMELYPRLSLDSSDDPSASKGRLRFATFSSPNAGVGIPGDSPAAITIGTTGKGENLTGVGPNVALRIKPDLLVPGTIATAGTTLTGTATGAGFVGGTAASLLSAGVRVADLTRTVGIAPGQPLVLPMEWLNTVNPRAQGRRER